MKSTPYKIPKLTPAEKELVETLNSRWNKEQALTELTKTLQVAVTIELATIPIYLSAYYSIERTPSSKKPHIPQAFPKTEVSRFADEAGAVIMSVAVEEMLHLSLAANVLYSLGEDPKIYGEAPASYPASLPGHKVNSLNGDNDSMNLPIPLAKFSFDQLSHFLAIEYPAPVDAPPESGEWDTIGQVYSYVRCIISSKWITDSNFRVRQHSGTSQIRSGEYSPNSIDTVFPKTEFNYTAPLPPAKEGSTAKSARFASNENSHVGASQLLDITNCHEALEAIATICFQGEGFAHEAYDDDDKAELSHYYKFLSLQSMLEGYTKDYIKKDNNIASLPKAPNPPKKQYSEIDLSKFVFPAPENPSLEQFTEGRAKLVSIADGLFQYMLIMTETVYKIPSREQKLFFNRTMHQSMIWVLDKLLQALRGIQTADGEHTLCATFANINLGERSEAFATLKMMCIDFEALYGKNGTTPKDWYNQSDASYYLRKITELPDVSVYWQALQPVGNPQYLHSPSSHQGIGTGGTYAGIPQWPLSPPKSDRLPEGALRHACMGLNSCKNQGRTTYNECAGQGYCSTSLSYNPIDPKKPSIADHTCHVLNDCRGQGGCGLYGTQSEQANPGSNECQSRGSCATPINAERFITDGDLRGTSVWQQARQVFTERVWPELQKENSNLPCSPPEVPGSDKKPNLFQYGPTIGWIENDNDGKGMTACGSSGMSGAGSCA